MKPVAISELGDVSRVVLLLAHPALDLHAFRS
jgi:hypothetical protein